MLRTLLTRRWVTALAIALAFAVAAVLLGNWQYSRHEERLVNRDRIEAHYGADPMPLQQALPSPADSVDREQDWLRVSADGSYLAEQQMLVRNRPNEGVFGYEVIVPLRLDAGGVLLVDRGWVRNAEAADILPDVPPAPAGRVEVVGWLRPGEQRVQSRLPEGQLASVNPADAAEQTGLDVHDGYLVLGAEDTGSGAPPERPAPLEAPRTGLGSHFAYALQWWLTAPLGLVMVAVFVRREHREQAGVDGVGRGAPQPARRTRIWDEEDE